MTEPTSAQSNTLSPTVSCDLSLRTVPFVPFSRDVAITRDGDPTSNASYRRPLLNIYTLILFLDFHVPLRSLPRSAKFFQWYLACTASPTPHNWHTNRHPPTGIHPVAGSTPPRRQVYWLDVPLFLCDPSTRFCSPHKRSANSARTPGQPTLTRAATRNSHRQFLRQFRQFLRQLCRRWHREPRCNDLRYNLHIVHCDYSR
ncbi:hypothetical protein OF83DRAFT_817629 [Amylostereum chailletii]|nr:hypothetical protein OF83DRAFT_817629 [Amylostereum chailletii]